jgi:hypothetical protein
VHQDIALPKRVSLEVELCRNVNFRRHFPIHKIFERSCELGVFGLTADVVSARRLAHR